MYMLNMVIILIVMYCNVVTAIDKIPTYLLRFNTHQHTQNYSMAREAYLQIQEAYPVRPELPQLQVADLCVGTTIINAVEVRQHNCQLPWIWSFRSTVDEHGT